VLEERASATLIYLLDGLQDNGGGVDREGTPGVCVGGGLEQPQGEVEVVSTLDDASCLEGSYGRRQQQSTS